MTGTSALCPGVALKDENAGNARSSSRGRDGDGGACTAGICWNGRKSEEPVLEDLSRDRLTSRPEVFGRSAIDDHRSPFKVATERRWTGDNGGGGLRGGRLAGLNGM
jgi:hypothetical protein